MAIIFDQRGKPVDTDNPFPVTLLGAGGSGDPPAVQLSGSKTVEPTSGTGNATIEFDAPVVGMQINNHTGDVLTLTVEGETFGVPNGVTFEYRNGPFDEADVVASGPGAWYALGLR